MYAAGHQSVWKVVCMINLFCLPQHLKWVDYWSNQSQIIARADFYNLQIDWHESYERKTIKWKLRNGQNSMRILIVNSKFASTTEQKNKQTKTSAESENQWYLHITDTKGNNFGCITYSWAHNILTEYYCFCICFISKLIYIFFVHLSLSLSHSVIFVGFIHRAVLSKSFCVI